MNPMTAREVIRAAQGVVADYTDRYPRSEAVMFHRINVRQRQLFALVREWDPEYYGVCATQTLVGGAANLTAWEAASVYPIESLDKVVIGDPGASALAAGRLVHVVPADDVDGHLAPRMTLRSHVLEQVGTDLQDVTSVKIYYSRRPKRIDEEGRVESVEDQSVEIVDPFDYLLVWDLARDLVVRTINVEAATKAATLGIVDKMEAELLGDFRAHVQHFAHAREDRFDHG